MSKPKRSGVFHVTAGALTEAPSIDKAPQKFLRIASQEQTLDAPAVLAAQRAYQEQVRNAIRTGAPEPQFG